MQIHNFVVKQCVWNNSTLEVGFIASVAHLHPRAPVLCLCVCMRFCDGQHTSWRVDVKAQSREHEELNDTSAILQFQTKVGAVTIVSPYYRSRTLMP